MRYDTHIPTLDLGQARNLLLDVVNQHYAERHSPLPGAFVKAQMLEKAKENGGLFSERDLGFRKFIDFVRTVPEVAIQGRPGSDSLLAPATASEVLSAYASPLPSASAPTSTRPSMLSTSATSNSTQPPAIR